MHITEAASDPWTEEFVGKRARPATPCRSPIRSPPRSPAAPGIPMAPPYAYESEPLWPKYRPLSSHSLLDTGGSVRRPAPNPTAARTSRPGTHSCSFNDRD